MSTRLAIEQEVTRRLGGQTGDITSGSATTAVLTGLVDTTGDDNKYRGWLLIMPDAATAADRTRVITAWDDSAGEATFITRSDTDYSSETFMLLPRGEFTKIDMDNLLNDRLGIVKRTVQSVVPSVTDERWYSLGAFPWITTRSDVDAVYYRVSPGINDNGIFDGWRNGPAAAPTGWTASSATIARTNFVDNPTQITRGLYGLSLTGSGGTGTLVQYLPTALVLQLRGRSLTLEADSLASATTAVITITDTAGSTTAAHTGGGDIERLSATRTIDASADSILIQIEEANSVTSTWDNVLCEEANAINNLYSTVGDTSWKLNPQLHEIRDIGGGAPVLELPTPRGNRAQFVIFSRQPYPTLSADDEVTDCPDNVIVPALMFELARRLRKGEDRERLDRIQAQAGREYARMAAKLIQRPTPQTQTSVVIGSA